LTSMVKSEALGLAIQLCRKWLKAEIGNGLPKVALSRNR